MPEQLPITTYGLNILREKSEPIKEINLDIIRLVENMFYTMDNAEGVGLAAPQINRNISLCIVDISVIDEYKKVKPITLINPVITDKYGEDIKEEGCLSIPDVRGNVLRSDKILVKYNDFDMNEKEFEAEGYLSRVIQHEIDHLHGVLFVDHLVEEDFKKVKSHLNKIKKNKIIPHYPIINNRNEIVTL